MKRKVTYATTSVGCSRVIRQNLRHKPIYLSVKTSSLVVRVHTIWEWRQHSEDILIWTLDHNEEENGVGHTARMEDEKCAQKCDEKPTRTDRVGNLGVNGGYCGNIPIYSVWNNLAGNFWQTNSWRLLTWSQLNKRTQNQTSWLPIYNKSTDRVSEESCVIHLTTPSVSHRVQFSRRHDW
jgi:hypothetical protein